MLFDIYPKEFKILVQFSHSVTSNSFNPMDCSMPGFPALYYLPNFAQTHVHWDGDNTEPSHPLCTLLLLPAVFPSISLFQRVSSSHQVAKVLEIQLQHHSFHWIFKTDFLWDWLVWSPCSSQDSQESSPTPQFKSIKSSMLSFLYGPTFTSIHDYWENHNFD